MELVAHLLHLAGLATVVVGTAWLLVLVFKDSVAMGVITLWLLPLIYAFVAKNWQKSKYAFIVHITGVCLLVIRVVFFGEYQVDAQ